MLAVDKEKHPIPTPEMARKRYFPFPVMKVGESFTVSCTDQEDQDLKAKRMWNLLRMYKINHPEWGRFRLQRMGDVIRVWRVK